ncbi:MAG: hypothetical protein Hals2KO_35390 [Halioglobus sp.]
MTISILNGVFLAAYSLSALVQLNDPDALPWVAIYLAAAAMCALWFRQRARRAPLPRWLPATLLLISLGWSASLVPAIAGEVSWGEIFESVSMRTRAVEEAREIGGLLLVAIWSATLLLLRLRTGSLTPSA